MPNHYSLELTLGLSVVESAAKICQQVQATITPDVMDKKDNSPVTIADFASQAIICRGLAQAFPNDPVIAEESSSELSLPQNSTFLNDITRLVAQYIPGTTRDEICGWIDRGSARGSTKRFWTLDPIDGTKGFLRRDQYAISLALIVDGQITVAILACPNFGSAVQGGDPLYAAIRGEGAYASEFDRKSTPQRIRVTQTAESTKARLCESFESGHSSHDESTVIAKRLGIQTPSVRMDSQAKYAAVACGAADVYLRLPTKRDYREKIWDHAAGVLIVEEAGGKVTDLAGNRLDFTAGRELDHNRGVVVTNGALHDEILAATQSVVGMKS